ncbi:helix-turn-helix domain-containing protein [Vibrio mediterranei]|uniref:helix-turn-helix domain-containing protein n=1 Tax=Vibrio mediterranei TaxID=689 RepID=UPI0038D17FA4
MIIKDKSIEYKISKAERVILLCLFENQNDVVSYEYLMNLGWGSISDSTKASLSVSISNIRKCLTYTNFTIITSRKEGYVLKESSANCSYFKRLKLRMRSLLSSEV